METSIDKLYQQQRSKTMQLLSDRDNISNLLSGNVTFIQTNNIPLKTKQVIQKVMLNLSQYETICIDMSHMTVSQLEMFKNTNQYLWNSILEYLKITNQYIKKD